MNKRKLVMVGGIANTFEWYDYALFAHLAPIIGEKFFPKTDPSSALLQVFLVFAVGYLMRPLGGIFFGIVGDRFGRKTALSTAIICMAVPTAAIGFLPTYESWGIASTSLMIVVRMMQGLSMGGSLTGSVSFLIEHTKKEQRGFFGSISMASICAGILLGSVVLFLVKNILTDGQFNDWGWRIPFIIGIVIYFVGTYIKNHTSETPLFEDAKARGEVLASPLKTVFKHYSFDMIISILINMTGSIIFYFAAVYLVSYLKVVRGFSYSNVTYLMNSCYATMIFIALFAGWISDKIGRKKIFLLNLICIIITMPFLLEMMENGNFTTASIALVLIATMAAFYIGPEPALQAEFYPTAVRNTAISVSYNTATSVFGGTTPYIIESLIQHTGTITSSVYYIVISAIIGIIALYFYEDRSLKDHKVHINPND